jgi:hypothetical protein
MLTALLNITTEPLPVKPPRSREPVGPTTAVVASDKALDAWMLAQVTTQHHSLGTGKMGLRRTRWRSWTGSEREEDSQVLSSSCPSQAWVQCIP